MKKLHYFFARAFIGRVVNALENIDGGVLCRVDDNRHLAILLANKAPDLLREHPEIYDWLRSNERFFSALADAKVYNHGKNQLRNNRERPRHFDFDKMSAFFTSNIKHPRRW